MPSTRFQTTAAAIACLGMLISPLAMAAPPGQPGAVVDVALGEGGVLRGVLVNANGALIGETPVSIRSAGREVLRVTTNARGEFAAPGLKGGVYELAAGKHHGVYRVWAPGTAPPSANHGVLAVSGDIMRGQYAPPPVPLPEPVPGYVQPVPYTPGGGPGPLGRGVHMVKQHPWIAAGVVATAIAVPVAVVEYDDDPAS